MNEDRHLTTAGANLIKHFEGCLHPHQGKFKSYVCPAGVTTIGWGSTGPPHGPHKIGKDTIWTQEQCDEALLQDMEEFEKHVRRLVTVSLTPWQFDSLTSFCYNVGAGNLAKSTLLKKVNAKDFTGAAQEFHKWNKANGKALAGLTRRRASEACCFKIPQTGTTSQPIRKPPLHAMPQAVDHRRTPWEQISGFG
jgi:lysozyme